MQRITLPSGATADLRDVADVTERQRRPIKRAQMKLASNQNFVASVKDVSDGENMTPEAQLALAAEIGPALDDLDNLNDLLIPAMVAGWSYGFPVSADAALDMPGRDYDALRKAVAPFMSQLSPDFEPSADPASPIAPSGA